LKSEVSDDIVKRYEKGESSTALSKVFGYHGSTITKLLNDRGVTIRGPQKIDYEKEKDNIIERYNNFESAQSIGKQYNISGDSITRVLAKWGIERRREGFSSLEKFKENVCSLYRKGATMNEIGTKYNCSPTAVSNFLKKCGVKIRVPAEAIKGKDGEICCQYLAGVGSAELGEKYGVSGGAIIGLLRRNGVSIRRQHLIYTFSTADIEDILDRYDRGESCREIGEVYSVRQDIIKKHLKENGERQTLFQKRIQVLRRSTDKIIEYYKKNKAVDWIARKFGVGNDAITDIIRDANISLENRFKKRTDEGDTLIVENYLSGMSIKSIAGEENISGATVTNILNEKNITLRKCELEKFNEREIIRKYTEGKSCPVIASDYGVSPHQVGRFLGSRVKMRKGTPKYSSEEGFFEVIDTEAKAYFLGLFFADGNISFPKGYAGSYATASLALQEKDKHILETFREFLKTKKPLYMRDNSKKTDTWKGRPVNRQNSYSITMNDKATKHLMRYKLTPNKSLTVEFPEGMIPDGLMCHFIRGYFDGDGWLTIKNKKPIHFGAGMCISKVFGEPLSRTIKRLAGIEGKIYSCGKINTYQINNHFAIDVFLDWIYENSNSDLRLKRKYERYIRFKREASIELKTSSFHKSREVARGLGFKGAREYVSFCRSDKNTFGIGAGKFKLPQQPCATFKNSGWVSWYDFLDYSKQDVLDIKKKKCKERSLKRWATYSEAKKIIKPFGLKSGKNWRDFCKSGRRPPNIPSNLCKTYSRRGEWVSHRDFFSL